MPRVIAAMLVLVLPAPAFSQARPAMLTVRGLKADAVLMIGEYQAQQTGSERVFQTPPLEPGKTFVYKLKATWSEKGEARSAEREAEVRAGQHTVVDFSTTAKMPLPQPKTRVFEFRYETTITGLKPDQQARVWIPIPPNTPEQTIEIVGNLPGKVEKEQRFGNQIMYLLGQPDSDGNLTISFTVKVTRKEVLGDMLHKNVTRQEIELFLKPDAKVPLNGPKAMALLKDHKLPKDQMELGRLFYDIVNEHVKYGKPADVPWGHGDSELVCDSRVGNCCDFHSLFIGLSRSHKMPAKFEMGFPIPPARGEGAVGGYHCWAWFKPEGRGWIPVDISEANKVKDKDPKTVEYYYGNLTEDRVVFTTGRDIHLVPKQDGPPLNYFIYPYVEVDGKPYDKANIKNKFSYKDVK